MLYDSIYLKYKIESVVLEVSIMVTFGRGEYLERDMRKLQGSCLCSTFWSGYYNMGYLQSVKFFELYICDFCSFLCDCYTSKRFQKCRSWMRYQTVQNQNLRAWDLGTLHFKKSPFQGKSMSNYFHKSLLGLVKSYLITEKFFCLVWEIPQKCFPLDNVLPWNISTQCHNH